MAANQGKKIRKLYFDVGLPATRTSQAFACTQFAAATPGDRYGALMQALEAATGSTPSGIKQQRTVSAWFQSAAAVMENTTTPVPVYNVNFVQPTTNVSNVSGTLGNNLNLNPLAYFTLGLSVTSGLQRVVPSKAGHEAIFGTAGILRHFAVQISKARAASVGGSVTVHGVLYVQRQHTIEV